jgi:hypothetical protein
MYCPIVGEGCAGPPYPSIRKEPFRLSAISRTDGLLCDLARALARIFAPMIAPSQITSRDLVLMVHYSVEAIH